MTTALTDLAAPARDRAARFWIGTARGENGKTRLTFLWEPAPRNPWTARRRTRGACRADRDRADGRPIFRGRVPEPRRRHQRLRPPTGATTASRAADAAGAGDTFDVQPGQLELKMVVEGSRGQVDRLGRARADGA